MSRVQFGPNDSTFEIIVYFFFSFQNFAAQYDPSKSAEPGAQVKKCLLSW